MRAPLTRTPCAARLPGLKPAPRAAAVDALAAAVTTHDARTLALLLAAGATRLHLDDFDALLRSPFAPGWRLWRADVSRNGPPPRRCSPAELPPWLAVVDGDGALVPAPPEQGWLRLLASAPALASLAVENGEREEAAATTPALSALLRGLRAAPALRRLALGFFDAADDGALAPLLRLKLLTRLELSHLPQLSDAGLRAICDALTALTHLRLDYLAVADAGFARLDRLRSLTWLEVRVRC